MSGNLARPKRSRDAELGSHDEMQRPPHKSMNALSSDNLSPASLLSKIFELV